VTRRTYVHLPLFIYGVGRDPFHEETHTISIYEAGGLISLASSVRPGQQILVANQGNDQTHKCVVVSVSAQPAGNYVEFTFLTPAPRFWSGLEIGNSLTLRNWSEYLIEALIPIIRADRAPGIRFATEHIAIPPMPKQSKMLGPFVPSGEDLAVLNKSGGLNGSTQR